jgi:hypothetical protein
MEILYCLVDCAASLVEMEVDLCDDHGVVVYACLSDAGIEILVVRWSREAGREDAEVVDADFKIMQLYRLMCMLEQSMILATPNVCATEMIETVQQKLVN